MTYEWADLIPACSVGFFVGFGLYLICYTARLFIRAPSVVLSETY